MTACPGNVLNRKRKGDQPVFFVLRFRLASRTATAFLALSFRSWAVMFAAAAFPPALPPFLPPFAPILRNHSRTSAGSLLRGIWTIVHPALAYLTGGLRYWCIQERRTNNYE